MLDKLVFGMSKIMEKEVDKFSGQHWGNTNEYERDERAGRRYGQWE
jgi:hypothetical protein